MKSNIQVNTIPKEELRWFGDVFSLAISHLDVGFKFLGYFWSQIAAIVFKPNKLWNKVSLEECVQ